MSNLSKLTAGLMLAGGMAMAAPAGAASYSTIYSFGAAPAGTNSFSGLVNVGGTLYGTTYFGGATNSGTVYSVTPGGHGTMLYAFQGGVDGVNPWGGLTGVDGVLYGTTLTGGAHNQGTVFKLTKAGVKTTLYSFAGGLDGRLPVGSLTKSGSFLYGTTSAGGLGSGCGAPGCGTVFRLSPTGKESVVFRFGNYQEDALAPLGTLLAQDREFYGTTYNSYDLNVPLGAIFKVDKKGNESVLHLLGFGKDGADPVGGLINVNGTFYGTTESGGDNEYGTVFSIKADGTEKVLYSFKGGKTDGAGPQTALINVGGVLYGTTGNGGSASVTSTGTLFKITLDGKETVLHKFGPLAGPDGSVPLGNLVELNGKLYGTTYAGGINGTGTVFEVTP